MNPLTKEEVMQQLSTIFRNVFDDESLQITEATSAADIDEWDSLEQINLLVAIEKNFGIKFHIADVEGLENVGDMADLVLRKKAQ